jgi:radical SAM-linked protein
MRVRIIFSKQGALRYTGHLDLHKLWERAVRRTGLPLSYSQGYHPQPRISLAAALPLGYSSRGEVLDIRLNEDLPLDEIRNRLKDSLPPDIQILEVANVDERNPALQTRVRSAVYEIEFTEPVDAADLTRKVEEMMNLESIPRSRRDKSYDLRPLIEMISLIKQPTGGVQLRMTLSAREGATGRPDEVLEVLGIVPDSTRIERIGLIFIS